MFVGKRGQVMALRKQAKLLSQKQVVMVSAYLDTKRHALRNKVMFLLSVRAGLRAKEIGLVQWSHLVGSDGCLMDELHLPNLATKGNSGRVIPLQKDLAKALQALFDEAKSKRGFDVSQTVIQSQKGGSMDRQAVVNWFRLLYKDLGLVGASSHSGRRTFATELGRRLSNAGCSINDLKTLMGHSNISVTNAYLEQNPDGQRALVNVW